MFVIIFVIPLWLRDLRHIYIILPLVDTLPDELSMFWCEAAVKSLVVFRRSTRF